jgi:hypothetical protein
VVSIRKHDLGWLLSLHYCSRFRLELSTPCAFPPEAVQKYLMPQVHISVFCLLPPLKDCSQKAVQPGLKCSVKSRFIYTERASRVLSLCLRHRELRVAGTCSLRYTHTHTHTHILKHTPWIFSKNVKLYLVINLWTIINWASSSYNI